MAEDVNDNLGAELPKSAPTQEVDPFEAKAREMGWRPKEDFVGDEADFIDAKEYVRRKPLFDKIEYQSKQLKDLRRSVDEFKQHFNKVRETEYKRALDALKAERSTAVREGDGEKFEAIDTQIKAVEAEVQEIRESHATAPQQTGEDAQEFQTWKRANGWYQKDSEMTEFADALGVSLHRKGLSPNEVLQQVEARVKKAFPEKFTNPNKTKAPDVESSKGGKNTASIGDIELTATERKIMLDFERQGIMSRKEYIDSLKTVR